METKKHQIIIPLDEYNNLINLKKAIEEKSFFIMEYGDSNLVKKYYFSEEGFKDEFVRLKKELEELYNRQRAALIKYHKQLNDKSKHGN